MATDHSPKITKHEERILRDLYRSRNVSAAQVRDIKARRNK